MKTAESIKSILVASLIALSIGSPVAFAGGFFGDIVETACGGCGLGRAGDDFHKRIGQPGDRIGAAVITSYTGMPMGHMCVTLAGAAHAAIQPMGTPCSVSDGYNLYWGVIQ